MRTIYKYELTLGSVNKIPLPMADVKILSVGNQRNDVCMWVELDTINKYTGKAPKLIDREFIILGTGHPLPNHARFIGTVIAEPFVWHIYEVSVDNPYRS